MKRWESSETRFGRVSRRSEPCSRGKRPFEVSKNFRDFFFRRRKIECCKSSETRVAEVSCRSELCSRGKRPFEVSKHRSKRIEIVFLVGVKKRNVGNCLKRVFPKFGGCMCHFRWVNVRSKFGKKVSVVIAVTKTQSTGTK